MNSHTISKTNYAPVFLHGFLADREILEKVSRGCSRLSMISARIEGFQSAYDQISERLVLLASPGDCVSGYIVAEAPEETNEQLREVYRGQDTSLQATLGGGQRVDVCCFNVHDTTNSVEIGKAPSKRLILQILDRYLSDRSNTLSYSRDRRWKGALLYCLQKSFVETKRQAKETTPPEVISEKEVIFRGYLSVDDLTFTRANLNQPSPKIRRSVAGWGDMVFVLPYDPRSRQVLLVEQFRPGKFAREGGSALSVGPVGGRCDREEPHTETARREALEEAGVQIESLHRVPSYYSSPGLSSEHVTGFIGKANLSEAGGVFGLDWEGEETRAFTLSIEQAVDLVRTGGVDSSHGLVALLYLAQNEKAIRLEWGA